mmetsp:Transcript_27970/g.80831  ORF Transcript_27970/g.80831 Transcript_27970/m.80831 type:complete len:226 (+) Transcript_27970:1825-2502(+)
MDDASIMNVPDCIYDLLDEPSAFGLGVVDVLLGIETVKEVATQTKLLHEVDGRRTLVHLFQPDDVGMVQLAHDGNLLPELLQFALRLDLAEIQLLHRVFVPRLLVRHLAHDAGDAGAQLLPVVHTVVHRFDRLAQLRFDGDQHLVLGLVERDDGLGAAERPRLGLGWPPASEEWSGSWWRFARCCCRCGCLIGNFHGRPSAVAAAPVGARGGGHAATVVIMVLGT